MKSILSAPRTDSYHFRINPEVRKEVEAVYAKNGISFTQAINIFIQQSINVDGLPFVVTQKSKAARFEQSVARLMAEIAVGEESAKREGWIDASEVEAEFGAKS